MELIYFQIDLIKIVTCDRGKYYYFFAIALFVGSVILDLASTVEGVWKALMLMEAGAKKGKRGLRP